MFTKTYIKTSLHVLVWVITTIICRAIDESEVKIGDICVRNVIETDSTAFPSRDNVRIAGAVGRKYYLLKDDELKELKIPSRSERSCKIARTYDGYYDLWDAVKELNSKPNSMLVLEIEIDSNQNVSKYLTLGSVDEAYVFLNGTAIYGLVGRRDLQKAHHIIPLKLTLGKNRINIVCRHFEKWRLLPVSRILTDWTVMISIYDSIDAALKYNKHMYFHPFDTAIINTYSDIRADFYVDGMKSVDLKSLTGETIIHGNICTNGEITWSGQKTNKLEDGAVVIAVVDGRVGEPLIITGNRSIEDFCSLTLHNENFWSIRLSVLLATDKQARDRWWARKVAQAVVMSRDDIEEETKKLGIDCCKVLKIRVKEFVSAIDGSIQFYRFYDAVGENLPNRDVIVYCPTVNIPIRSAFESPALANLNDFETMISCAEDEGISVLMPGYVDVDYGGLLARKELSECIEDLRKHEKWRNSKIYYFGCCSSGLVSIAAAATDQYEHGLILYSPVIIRNRTRWLFGTPVEPIDYPRELLKDEQTGNAWEKLVNVPTLLIFDSKIPGHGQEKEAMEFADNLKAAGGAVESILPPSTQDYIWGERFRHRCQLWNDWIKNQRHTNYLKDKKTFKCNEVNTLSVKAALLEGFKVNQTDDRFLKQWYSDWKNIWSLHRGRSWNMDRSDPCTIVELKTLAEIRTEFEQFVSRSTPIFPGKDFPKDNEHYFGFFLLGSRKVCVFRSGSTKEKLPPIDLLVDSPCKGALFKHDGAKWELSQVWK